MVFARKLVKRDLVMSKDQFAQIIEQLDDSQSLFGRPVVGKDEWDAALAARRQAPGFHDLDFRRCRARCSERSRASFSR